MTKAKTGASAVSVVRLQGSVDLEHAPEARTRLLDAVAQVDGPQSFALVAARSLTSLDGDQGKIDDEALELKVADEPVGTLRLRTRGEL